MTQEPLDGWKPELRRAMMRVRPEYFSWPQEQQERYGVAVPEEDRARLDLVLMQELFGRTKASVEQTESISDRLSGEELNLWNETLLPLMGIGEDYFFLNEHFREGDSILQYQTLREYDESEYRWQEEYRQKESEDYLAKPYRGYLYLGWARLFVDGKFTYATLSMAAGYQNSLLDELGSQLLEQRIPHQYVPGPHHGEQVGENTRWDMRVSADGQEEVLEELRERLWGYAQARYEALSDSWDARGLSGVYMLDESHEGERELHLVFTDKEALSRVRFRSFMRDCRAIRRDADELYRAVSEEKSALSDFIEAQHAEVLSNHDPKVRRLRKRNKVMIAKGAFDGL
ncbi:hypothetical protein H0484_13625 [Pusillimonas sp. CC-YST705]|uniref:Uncharacterized protein n=1 Tax=Mesopusillimonas faecipullorum TaxID=2755040 RepID=A0ABS8CFI7_9BURK|nr:hypothetical protein [Mesopusillimonas faecipullorum]MCB5364788.1 hypothetical protein [Mesopusillimonas faecipullorum]